MDIAAVLFVVSMLLPPAVVLIGAILAVWPMNRRAHAKAAPPVPHAVAQH